MWYSNPKTGANIHGCIHANVPAKPGTHFQYDDRVTPPVAAAFSLVMMAGTNAGDVYTFVQYEKMFGNAGFGKTTLHPVPDIPQQVLVSVK